MDEMKLATDITHILRAQKDGEFVIERDEAVGLIAQALRSAFTEGSAVGARSTGDSMLRAFDVVVGRQAEAAKS